MTDGMNNNERDFWLDLFQDGNEAAEPVSQEDNSINDLFFEIPKDPTEETEKEKAEESNHEEVSWFDIEDFTIPEIPYEPVTNLETAAESESEPKSEPEEAGEDKYSDSEKEKTGKGGKHKKSVSAKTSDSSGKSRKPASGKAQVRHKKPAPVTSKRSTGRRNSLSRRKKKELVKNSLIFIVALSFAIVFLTPIVLTITNSFMSQTEINANYGAIFAKSEKGGKIFISEVVNLKFIPDMVSFEQYITVLFKSPDYLIKFWNSVFLVVPIVIFQLGVAVLASYGFTRLKGKLKEIVFFAYIILMLMPYQVTLVPNYLVSNWLHIIDTRWAIWLPGIASPFAVYLLTKFMRRIPLSYIEAAQIDGAGEWQIFKKICFPLSKSCLYSVAILVFIDYWNMVEQPLILLSDTEMHPLSVFLSQINSGETGLAFAVATIYMVPGLLVFLYGEDYLVEGIMYQGGIKG